MDRVHGHQIDIIEGLPKAAAAISDTASRFSGSGMYAAISRATADDQAAEVAVSEKARNVLGGELADCSERPLTGFFRDGCCNTSAQDRSSYTVCVLMTAEFGPQRLAASAQGGHSAYFGTSIWGMPAGTGSW